MLSRTNTSTNIHANAAINTCHIEGVQGTLTSKLMFVLTNTHIHTNANINTCQIYGYLACSCGVSWKARDRVRWKGGKYAYLDMFIPIAHGDENENDHG